MSVFHPFLVWNKTDSNWKVFINLRVKCVVFFFKFYVAVNPHNLSNVKCLRKSEEIFYFSVGTYAG